MKPAASAREFLNDPFDRYWAGRTWMAFCARPRVAGFMIWGEPSVADAESLLQVIALRDSPLAVPMTRWVDLRRMGVPDAAAFLAFAEYFGKSAAWLRPLVPRAVVLHAGGITGALAFGFGKVVLAPYPIDYFTDPSEAATSLALGEGASFVRELDEAQAASVGVSPLLRDLRAWLGARLRTISLRDAAAALSMSARSLQRRLREHGTSFQDEVSAARIVAAQRMLRETDAPVTVIAHEVGCASVHHFGALFRRTIGTAPSRWRAAQASPA